MGDKRLNIHLVLWLAGSLAVAAVGVHLLHAFQMRRHEATLQEQVRRAEDAGQKEQTAALLKRYLLFAPDDTDALLHYGQTLEKPPADSANRWLAAAAYQQVLARWPKRGDVRERLASLLLDLEDYVGAREQIELQLQASPKDARLEGRLAHCLEEDGEYDQALRAYENAVEHDPTQVECYTRRAALLYNRFNQPAAADDVMNKLVAANDQNFAAYLDRCLYRMGLGQLDDAAKDMATAKKLAPIDKRVLTTAAELAYRRGRFDEARAVWNEGLKEHPEIRNMYLGLATLEIADKRPNEAVAVLRRGLEKYPDNPDLLHLLTEAYLAQNDISSAAEAEERVRRKGDTTLADYLRALILLHRGEWGAAIPLLEKALAVPDVPDPLACRMNVCLAQCYERLGDTDRCLAAYRRAVFLEPSHMPANLGLAAALLAAGKSNEVLAQYRPLAKIDRPPEEVWLLIGRTLLQRNQALPPNKRTWDEIERALQRAEQKEALLVPTALLRTDVLLAQGKPDEARKALEQARDRQPDKPALWVALANLAARRGDRAGAERILTEARAKLGDRFELRMAALEFGVGLDDEDAREKLLACEKDIEPYTPEEQRRLLAALATLYYQFRWPDDGERLTRELADRQPLDLPAAIAVLDLALMGRDDSLQARAVAELRRLEGDGGTWWRYGEARRQLLRALRGDRNAADEARRLLADIKKSRPDWSRAALLEAALCELNRDAAGAIQAYTKAFDEGERQPWVVQRLMEWLVAQGRPVEADAVMSRAQQQIIPSGALARFAAETALRVGQHERAANLARLAVPAESRDPWAFIWLGQLLAAANRKSEAEEALRHAVELRETVRDTWVALITYYANADRVDEADNAMRVMKDKLPPAQTPLAVALCEEALGRLDAAEQHYQEARTKQSEDGLTLQRLAAFYVRLQRTDKAEAALRGLLDPTLLWLPRAAAEENVAWARRQLAVLRAGADDAGYAEALKLLERNGNRSLADVRAAAFVKATRPQDRADALRTIEETMKLQPLTPDEQFHLARLYQADNDWSSAREQLEALLNLDRRNPEYLAYFIAALAERDQRGEARSWLAKLAKLEPGSARVKKWQSELK